MSLARMNFDSDSDDDPDFTPDAGTYDNDSSSQASEPSAKRTKFEKESLASEAAVTEEEVRASAWAAFQAKVADSSHKPIQQTMEVRMVTIEKQYRFAGEEVIKTIEVPEDSKEGKMWLAAQNSLKRSNDSPPVSQSTPAASPPLMASSVQTPPETLTKLASRDDQPPPTSKTAAKHGAPVPVVSSPTPVTPASVVRVDSPSSDNQPSKTSDPVKVHPKPKLKSGGLTSLNKARPKRLSTLEKSRMDWTTHVASEGNTMKEELDANRRSGGYIEKVEFLGRVSERMEDALESAKGGKRKR